MYSNLPEELVLLVFEIAAEEDIQMALTLLRVCRRVHYHVQPYLFQNLTFYSGRHDKKRIREIRRKLTQSHLINHREADQNGSDGLGVALLDLDSSIEFFSDPIPIAPYIKSICIDYSTTHSTSDLIRILSESTALYHFATFEQPNPPVIPLHFLTRITSLRSLAGDLGSLFSASPTLQRRLFSHDLFSSRLTHLAIGDLWYTWTSWDWASYLQDSPLTHLALAYTPFVFPPDLNEAPRRVSEAVARAVTADGKGHLISRSHGVGGEVVWLVNVNQKKAHVSHGHGSWGPPQRTSAVSSSQAVAQLSAQNINFSNLTTPDTPTTHGEFSVPSQPHRQSAGITPSGAPSRYSYVRYPSSHGYSASIASSSSSATITPASRLGTPNSMYSASRLSLSSAASSGDSESPRSSPLLGGYKQDPMITRSLSSSSISSSSSSASSYSAQDRTSSTSTASSSPPASYTSPPTPHSHIAHSGTPATPTPPALWTVEAPVSAAVHTILNRLPGLAYLALAVDYVVVWQKARTYSDDMDDPSVEMLACGDPRLVALSCTNPMIEWNPGALRESQGAPRRLGFWDRVEEKVRRREAKRERLERLHTQLRLPDQQKPRWKENGRGEEREKEREKEKEKATRKYWRPQPVRANTYSHPSTAVDERMYIGNRF